MKNKQKKTVREEDGFGFGAKPHARGVEGVSVASRAV